MLSATFARYPAIVVTRVMDPFNGLPAKSKFLPTISEVHEACEREMGAIIRQRDCEDRIAAQLAERRRMEAMTDAERRREVVRKWREGMAKSDVAAADITDLSDVRRAGNAETKGRVAAHWLGKLAENAARYAGAPCVLSNEARAGLGFRPLPEPAEERV